MNVYPTSHMVSVSPNEDEETNVETDYTKFSSKH